MNTFFDVIKKFNEFKKNYKGDAKREIEILINNGKLSRQDYEKYKSQAEDIMNLIR